MPEAWYPIAAIWVFSGLVALMIAPVPCVTGEPSGLKALSFTVPVSHIRVPLGWTTRKHVTTKPSALTSPSLKLNSVGLRPLMVPQIEHVQAQRGRRLGCVLGNRATGDQEQRGQFHGYNSTGLQPIIRTDVCLEKESGQWPHRQDRRSPWRQPDWLRRRL